MEDFKSICVKKKYTGFTVFGNSIYFKKVDYKNIEDVLGCYSTRQFWYYDPDVYTKEDHVKK